MLGGDNDFSFGYTELQVPRNHQSSNAQRNVAQRFEIYNHFDDITGGACVEQEKVAYD